MKLIWIQKIFIIITWLCIGFWWYTSSQYLTNITNWDCRFVADTMRWNFWSWVESRSGQNETIFPQASIKRALWNLKKYCCAQWILDKDGISCTHDEYQWSFLESTPDSKFLYDHLVDIWFRRLDAMENLLYPDVTPDPIWEQRRKYINNKWAQLEWTTPTDMMPNFKKQWTFNINYDLAKREDGKYNQMENPSRNATIPSYENRPLINRYQNMCEIAAYIYGYIIPMWWLDTYTRQNGYSSCTKLSQKIIANNIDFAQTIVLKKSSKLLYDNMDSHINKYLNQNRLIQLRSTILAITQALDAVNKKIIELVKSCS